MSRPTPGTRLRRAVIAAASLLVAGLAGSPVTASPTDDVQTAALKAAFVYNFAKFVTWPSDRFGSRSEPIRFCMQRHDLDRSALEQLVDKQIGERQVRVIVVDPGSTIDACHVLFVSGFASIAAFDHTLSTTRQSHVLVVSDQPGFAMRGGHIGLVEERGRLRFQVNLKAIADANLKLSSKLLQLAEIVGPVRE